MVSLQKHENFIEKFDLFTITTTYDKAGHSLVQFWIWFRNLLIVHTYESARRIGNNFLQFCTKYAYKSINDYS